MGRQNNRREDLTIRYQLAVADGDRDKALKLRDIVMAEYKTWTRILGGWDKWEHEFINKKAAQVQAGNLDVTIDSYVCWKTDLGTTQINQVAAIWKSEALVGLGGKRVATEMVPTDRIPAADVGQPDKASHYLVRFDLPDGGATFVMNAGLIPNRPAPTVVESCQSCYGSGHTPEGDTCPNCEDGELLGYDVKVGARVGDTVHFTDDFGKSRIGSVTYIWKTTNLGTSLLAPRSNKFGTVVDSLPATAVGADDHDYLLRVGVCVNAEQVIFFVSNTRLVPPLKGESK